MNTTKLLAVALAALVASAGLGAAATSAGTGQATAATTADVSEYDASANYDNGTVTFTVTANGSGVGGLGVAVDGASVGTTGADGSVAFAVNESTTENLTVTVSGENVTGEFTYALENGTLTLQSGGFRAATDEESGNETDDGPSDGPFITLPNESSDTAKRVMAIIQRYRTNDSTGDADSLGRAISAAIAGGPDGERGPPENAGPGGDDEADEEDGERGPPENAGNGDGDAGDDDAERGNGNANAGNGNANAGADDGGDDDEADEDDERGGNGNGNGRGA